VPVEDFIHMAARSASKGSFEPGVHAPRAARIVAVAAMSFLLGSGAATLAVAQTPDDPRDGGLSRHPCQVTPETWNNEAAPDGAPNGDTTAGQNDDAQVALEECNGVLVPPSIGDAEIVAPTPNIGTPPVIPPGAVPEQPADPGG